MGLGGLYNFGCEAIVRGTVSTLKAAHENVVITYYSHNPEEDSEQIADLNINIVRIKTKRGVVRRAANKLLSLWGSEKRFALADWRNILQDCDIVVSIGGDIYTIPAHIRKRQSYPYYSPLVQFGEYAIRNGKKVVIFGASIGPFGDYSKAVDYYINHLAKVSLVVAREYRCVNYLALHGVTENVCFYPDPVFKIRNDLDYFDTHNDCIAVNLSPLSFNEVFGSNAESISALSLMVKKLVAEIDLNIVLIPHVVSPDPNDNDYIFMKAIYDKLDEKTRSRVKLVNPRSFSEARDELAKCRIAIAARMHCALNAALVGTPPIFLSYSEKSLGMSRLIYGDESWAVGLDQIDSVPDLAKRLLDYRDEVILGMQSNIDRLQAQDFCNQVVKRLGKIIAESSSIEKRGERDN